jgi:Fe-S cluster biosynthesis and repair protein YggX
MNYALVFVFEIQIFSKVPFNKRHWQHWVHKNTGRRQARDTGNIGYTKIRDEDKPEILATLGTQKYGTKTSQRHWQHWVHKNTRLFIAPKNGMPNNHEVCWEQEKERA